MPAAATMMTAMGPEIRYYYGGALDYSFSYCMLLYFGFVGNIENAGKLGMHLGDCVCAPFFKLMYQQFENQTY